MNLGEAFNFSVQALKANPVRSFLTCLGMMIGNASVILVVTISLTSQEYILNQIQAIGSNMIYAYLETGSPDAAKYGADFVKQADVAAVRELFGDRIVAATGVVATSDRILVAGRQQDVTIIGSDQYYQPVRNLLIPAGRALDASDVEMRNKVAVLTTELAEKLFGSQRNAIGQVMKVFGLQFIIVGTFKERIESFGQTEVAKDSILIPYTVLRYFNAVERVDPMYVQVRDPDQVDTLALQIKSLLESRHRAGARYKVESLQAILSAARNISTILRLVLILISAIALIISGIGIMNIMLVTVTERTREIGIRMAIGAARREILLQFLIEAVIISLAGGVAGILLGLAMPLSVKFFTGTIDIPVSWISVAVAFGVSCVVGLVFGLLPANRASKLNPTEALRYE
jgi:putative ABC transport system permease protein